MSTNPTIITTTSGTSPLTNVPNFIAGPGQILTVDGNGEYEWSIASDHTVMTTIFTCLPKETMIKIVQKLFQRGNNGPQYIEELCETIEVEDLRDMVAMFLDLWTWESGSEEDKQIFDILDGLLKGRKA